MPFAFSIHPGAVLCILGYCALLAWFVWRWSLKSEDPPGVLISKLLATLGLGALAVAIGASYHPMIGIPIAAAIGILISTMWGRNIGAAMAKPLASLYDGGDEAPPPQAFYAVAEAHRKQARYDDAIREIEKQLERFPGDAEGLLKLAEIRARHLEDWTGAEAAIDQLAANSAVPVPTRAKALQALADWYLDFKSDNERATEYLRRIGSMFPDTPDAHAAAQRLAHVGDGAWRREQNAPSRFRVTQSDDRMGLRPAGQQTITMPSPERDPEAVVHELLAHLSIHPQDTEARERLALEYADRLGHPDWAAAEIEKLIAIPSQSGRQVARWLHRLADIHVRCNGDEAAARQALLRIVKTYPDSAVAANAQARLELLKVEIKGKQNTDRIDAKIVGTGPGTDRTA